MFERKHWNALFALGLFTFMSTLDGSIVNIALPTMAREMHISTSQVTWAVTIYLVVISSLILLFGRLGDLLGKTFIFRIGMTVFTIGSLLCGIHVNLPFLLGARVVQAIGASMTMSNSFGITAMVFPANIRARAMSIIAMFVSLGSIAGPAIGGFILEVVSWPFIFWINVPLGIIAYLVGNKYLPHDHNANGSVKDVDFVGAFLLFATVVTFFIGMTVGQDKGMGNPIAIGLLALMVVLIFAFIKVERVRQSPLLQLKIFDSKLFSMSVVTSMLMFTAGSFNGILMPFYLQNYRACAVGFAGFVMMAYPIAMFIFSPIAGTLADKYDKEKITFIGISLVILAQIGYLTIGPNTPLTLVIILLLLHGMGIGFFQSPNNALVMSNVDKQYLGIAGSVNALGRNLGFVIGNTVATMVLFMTMSTLAGSHITTYQEKHPEWFIKGFHAAFYIAFTLVLIAWIMAGVRIYQEAKAKKAA
jgi:EmrB/QacA subfamily drug resistance transporter